MSLLLLARRDTIREVGIESEAWVVATEFFSHVVKPSFYRRNGGMREALRRRQKEHLHRLLHLGAGQ